jgi:hypothetical protein
MKRFKITETYTDRCYFERKVIIKADDADEAVDLFHSEMIPYTEISNDIIKYANDPQDNEIEGVEEVK